LVFIENELEINLDRKIEFGSTGSTKLIRPFHIWSSAFKYIIHYDIRMYL